MPPATNVFPFIVKTDPVVPADASVCENAIPFTIVGTAEFIEIRVPFTVKDLSFVSAIALNSKGWF